MFDVEILPCYRIRVVVDKTSLHFKASFFVLAIFSRYADEKYIGNHNRVR